MDYGTLCEVQTTEEVNTPVYAFYCFGSRGLKQRKDAYSWNFVINAMKTKESLRARRG